MELLCGALLATVFARRSGKLTPIILFFSSRAAQI